MQSRGCRRCRCTWWRRSWSLSRSHTQTHTHAHTCTHTRTHSLTHSPSLTQTVSLYLVAAKLVISPHFVNFFCSLFFAVCLQTPHSHAHSHARALPPSLSLTLTHSHSHSLSHSRTLTPPNRFCWWGTSSGSSSAGRTRTCSAPSTARVSWMASGTLHARHIINQRPHHARRLIIRLVPLDRGLLKCCELTGERNAKRRWSIVTQTTVGHGDKAPSTLLLLLYYSPAQS